MKNTEKSIIEVTDDEWSGMLEILFGLDADPYSYDDITDNPWSFKRKNRGKRTSTFSSRHLISGFRVCESIFKSSLPTPMTRPSDGIIFTINFTPYVN
jgi:hypothetical protein